MGNSIGQAASAARSEVWTNTKTWNVLTNILFGIGKVIRSCLGKQTNGVDAVSWPRRGSSCPRSPRRSTTPTPPRTTPIAGRM